MNKNLLLFFFSILFYSCSNKTEEISDPKTGTVLKKYEYYLDENGQKVKDGISSEWYPDGNLRLTENYKNGKREGESIFYKSQDTIHVNNYENDKLNGKCILKNSRDDVLSLYHYSNGQLYGKVQYNYPNGKKHIVGEFTNNLQTGQWNYFDKYGKKVAILNFKDGISIQTLGKWLIDNNPSSYFIFREDGTYGMYEPYNKYSTNSTESIGGNYSVGNGFSMSVIMDLQKGIVRYNIEYFDENNMILTYNNLRWDLTKVKN